MDGTPIPHSSHWGAFSATRDGDTITVTLHPSDPDPNELIQNFPAALRHRARIARPMVRKGWLDNGPGPSDRRGRDSFVAVEWGDILDRLTAELARVRDTYGPGKIFGGSYGWSSAGCFHHAQSQVHRFLNLSLGGYVRSVNSYSAGASAVILPHILGPFEAVTRQTVTWDQIVAHTDIVIAVVGPSGCGKSTLLRSLAASQAQIFWMLRLPAHRQQGKEGFFFEKKKQKTLIRKDKSATHLCRSCSFLI